jgi:DNA-binding NarL/FixJ family response regulator
MANKKIAARLGVCLQTVKLHRGRLMRKLQLPSVAELICYDARRRSEPGGRNNRTSRMRP